MVKKKYLFLFIFAIISLCNLPEKAEAETINRTPFSASAILPENQIDSGKAYYDLLLKPGQSQTLEALLTNMSDEEIVVEAEVNPATTNNSGYIDYGQNVIKKPDSTLQFSLEKYAAVQSKKIIIPPKKYKLLKVNIKMPNKKIDGVIAGGVYIKAKRVDDTPVEDNSNSTIQMKDQSVYVIALQMQQNVKKNIKQNIEVDQKKIAPGLVYGRPAVNINIHNKAPAFVRHMYVVAEIYRGQKLLHRTVRDNLNMAPNSNFDLAVSWENLPLKSGDYTAKIILSDGNNNRSTVEKQVLQRDFRIERTTANQLNNKTPGQKPELIPYIIVAGCLLMIGIFVIATINRRKNQRIK